MGKKLTIYMLDGSATGPKTIEIGNWSGKAIFATRATLKAILNRSEFDSPGIYFLRSQSESYEFDESIYIGEAEELRSRLRQQMVERDFESVVCFLSKDEMLTKAHIKYLESRIIKLSREANSSDVVNSSNPKGSMLSEADISDMAYFIEQIRLILTTVGMNLLVDAAPRAAKAIKPPASEGTYTIKSKTLKATMVEIGGGFIVKAGSQARHIKRQGGVDAWCRKKRKLIDKGILKKEADSFVFLQDASFPSPSMASSVVLGCQASGLTLWENSRGQTYKEVQEGASNA